MQVSFNKVHVVKGEMAGANYTPEEFVKLPLNTRITMVIEDQISFLKNGIEVDKVTSLNELRKSAKAVAANSNISS
jgi:hypothetical protein